ncbi:MAG: arsenate reductase ArsC [Steroidobacter sp.]
MADKVYNVLVLCTGNSARSILCEALINHHGKGRFRAYSAGSFPTGRVNPYALRLLGEMNVPVDNPRSKSWDEFAQPGAPPLDFVITVCDNAAGEVCPVWPGHPVVAHWGVPDPAHIEGSDADKMKAFRDVYLTLDQRVRLFVSMSIDKLEHLQLKQQMSAIGKAVHAGQSS